MALAPIRDVNVAIGAQTVAFSEGVRIVKAGSADITKAIREVAEKSQQAARVQEEGARRVQAAREREIDAVRKAEAAAAKAAEAEIAAARRREAVVTAEAALIARKEAEIAAARDLTSRKAVEAAAVIERAKGRITAAYDAEATAKARATQRIVDLEQVRVSAAQRTNATVEREAARHATVVDRITARIAQAQGAGAPGAGSGARGARIQNAAFQVGDVFTQVAAGTDPVRAIAIQLPQLLGGFGVWGAVAGAAAAALAPLAMSMMDTADGAEEAKERSEALSDSVDALAAAVARSTAANAEAKKTVAELSEEYGSAAGAIAALNQRQAEVAARQAQLQVSATAGEIGGQFGDADRMVALLDRLDYRAAGGVLGKRFEVDFKGAIDQLEALDASLGIGEDAARGLYDRILELQSATGPADQAEAFRRMSDFIVETAGGTDRLTVAQAELVTKLDEAARQAELLAANAGDVTFDPAVASARALTAELARAQGQIAGLLASQAAQLRSAKLRLQYAGDPVGLAGATARGDAEAMISGLSGKERDDLAALPGVAEARAREAAQLEAAAAAAEAAAREALRPSSGGGRTARSGGSARSSGGSARAGGGAAAEQRAFNELLREAGSLYDATRTDAERYAEELANIQRLEAAGVLGLTDEQRERISGMSEVERAAVLAETAGQNAEVARRAIASLNDEYGQLGDVAQTVKDGARETFGSIITGASSAREAVAQLAQRLASMFADRAFEGIWSAIAGSIGGGSGGGVGGFFSSLLSGSFASGTDWAPRGLALVGERGPELVRFGGGEQVIPADRTRALLAGGNGGPTRIVIDTTPEFHARIERQQAQVAASTTRQGLAEYSRNVAPVRQAQIAANPRRRG
ncbi:MAG: hypothetical protein BWX69_03045 [Planctomycetes bacterium ADurb.Bin069]|nr:MAG: hypothetical protein BWX69_03045 [Planctomycetes bacterium ADurb.Bin069]